MIWFPPGKEIFLSPYHLHFCLSPFSLLFTGHREQHFLKNTDTEVSGCIHLVPMLELNSPSLPLSPYDFTGTTLFYLYLYSTGINLDNFHPGNQILLVQNFLHLNRLVTSCQQRALLWQASRKRRYMSAKGLQISGADMENRHTATHSRMPEGRVLIELHHNYSATSLPSIKALFVMFVMSC
jgi:hypothetical protein